MSKFGKWLVTPVGQAKRADRAEAGIVPLFTPPGAFATYHPHRHTMEVVYKDKVIGSRLDFKVTVPSQQTHGSGGAVLAVGVLEVGAKKTDLTVLVTRGTYSKGFTLHNASAGAIQRLYANIARIEKYRAEEGAHGH